MWDGIGQSGKHGGGFFLIVIVVGGLLLIFLGTLGVVARQLFGDSFPYAMGGLVCLIVAAPLARLCKRRADRPERYTIEPLSREEMKRARSKLLVNQPIRKL